MAVLCPTLMALRRPCQAARLSLITQPCAPDIIHSTQELTVCRRYCSRSHQSEAGLCLNTAAHSNPLSAACPALSPSAAAAAPCVSVSSQIKTQTRFLSYVSMMAVPDWSTLTCSLLYLSHVQYQAKDFKPLFPQDESYSESQHLVFHQS